MSEIDREIRRHYYDSTSGSAFAENASAINFWLGQIVGTHAVGEYQFLEFIELCFVSGPDYKKPTGKHGFDIYINGHSVGRYSHSLDEALITAIAFKRDGLNSQAARFFWKATRPDEGNY